MSISAPVAIEMTTVFGYIFDDDGDTPIENAKIIFNSKSFMLDDNLMKINETVYSDNEGRYQATLPQTVRIPIVVNIEIYWTDEDGIDCTKKEDIIVGDVSPISVEDSSVNVSGAKIIEQAKGDVFGPSSATANAIARYNSTSGKLIKDSSVIVADNGDITGAGTYNGVDISSLDSSSHTHANKPLLDTYDQTNADITDAISKKHTHANKPALDNVSGTNTGDQDLSSYLTETSHDALPSDNPHGVTKTQVGLSNVPNTDTTTTANITDSTNKRFMTDAQETNLDNQSNTNTGDQLPTTYAIPASDIDWSELYKSDGIYTKTVSGNTTFTFSNSTAGQKITVIITNSGPYSAYFPSNVLWPQGIFPSATPFGGKTVYNFIYDGSSWYGAGATDMRVV